MPVRAGQQPRVTMPGAAQTEQTEGSATPDRQKQIFAGFGTGLWQPWGRGEVFPAGEPSSHCTSAANWGCWERVGEPGALCVPGVPPSGCVCVCVCVCVGLALQRALLDRCGPPGLRAVHRTARRWHFMAQRGNAEGALMSHGGRRALPTLVTSPGGEEAREGKM